MKNNRNLYIENLIRKLYYFCITKMEISHQGKWERFIQAPSFREISGHRVTVNCRGVSTSVAVGEWRGGLVTWRCLELGAGTAVKAQYLVSGPWQWTALLKTLWPPTQKHKRGIQHSKHECGGISYSSHIRRE